MEKQPLALLLLPFCSPLSFSASLPFRYTSDVLPLYILYYQSMEWTGSIRWIHNPVQSMRIWIGLDQIFTNSADSGLDWIQKCAMCITYLET